MHPRITVFSSSEGLEVAEAIKAGLDSSTECDVWNQGMFAPGEFFLESILASVDKLDFAVFVFWPDDKTMSRGKEELSIRDNVIFELGIAIHALGRKRVFIIEPEDLGKIRQPSDLSGVNLIRFTAQRQDGNLLSALGTACRTMKAVIQKEGSRNPSTGSDHSPIMVVPPSPDALSKEADILLVEASNDQHAIVMTIRTNMGYTVQTNGRAMNDTGNPRSEAKWRSAVEKLVIKGYLRAMGHKGEVFELTEKGWQRADALKVTRAKMRDAVSENAWSSLMCAVEFDKTGIVFPKMEYHEDATRREDDLAAARELECHGWAEKREDGIYYVTQEGIKASNVGWQETTNELLSVFDEGASNERG